MEPRCRTWRETLPADFVGQDGILRPIGNRPACSARNSGETPAQFAARRFAGQDGILRGGCQPPLSLYLAKLYK